MNFLDEDADPSNMKQEFINRQEFKNSSQFKVNIEHKLGYKVVLECKCVPIIDENGKVQKLMYFAQDITQQTQTERKFLESEERYQKLVKSSPETTLIYGLDGKILYSNNAGLQLIGATNINQIIGKYVIEFLTKESIEIAQKDIKKVVSGEIITNEYTLTRPDGATIFTEALSYLTIFQGMDAIQVVARNITERKKTAEKLEYLAYYDTLTELGIQNALYKQIEIALLESTRLNQTMSILFMDLDRFKNINDTFGHSFGDKMLQKVTERLKLSMCKNCEVFRLDGDSFVILIKNSDSIQAEELAKKILQSFSKPLKIEERNIHVSFSIGISIYPEHAGNVESLFQNADTAMNTVKESGKNGYNFHTKQIKEVNDRKMEAIFSAIIDLGNKLGYDMVPEGVENKAQVEFLQIQNCKYAHGYFYSKPLPVEDLENKFHDKLKNSGFNGSRPL
ncbi:diguanylate cyclase domain-containing protein [Gottfriedia sp. NPDC057991]|uniref:diguanylate cyclase domain-containing protein n=1 Tax=Gottfriedia sp. NPDC057991 TaxID=3346298 RepID=UPI0036D82A6F